MRVLVTGGAGYIGSHTCLALIESGYEVVILDNFVNANPKVLSRLEQLAGQSIECVTGDIGDEALLYQVFDTKIDAVIHFAGLKAVGESVSHPQEYYENNLAGSLTLFRVMAEHDCRNIIFSSSATVYGDPAEIPIKESTPKGICTNPYGWTKWMLEQILMDLHKADNRWNVMLLRYFNPIGAHESGLIGEDPKGIPNNLVPYVAQVAIGQHPFVRVFGNDYDTPDGTGVRDYIHVLDLASGHVAALKHLDGCQVYNLGTGKGYSVLDVIHAYEKACGHDIPYQILERRPGDVASCYADPTLAKEKLGWSAQYDLEDMCRTSWKWQSTNPEGYQ